MTQTEVALSVAARAVRSTTATGLVALLLWYLGLSTGLAVSVAVVGVRLWGIENAIRRQTAAITTERA